MAAFAAARAQRGRTDAPCVADLLVELEQVGGHVGGDGAALLGGLARLLVDLLERRVAARRHLGRLGAQAVAFGGELVSPADQALPALHQLEHDLLEIALPAAQRLDLGLQGGQLAGGGHLPGVQPGAVPVDPGPDLLDVALCPILLPGQVAELGLGHDDLVFELAGPGLQAGELGDFGQAAPTVVEAAELGVEVGQFEQPKLALW